ncbi:hypothetical protein BC332_03357 [Capsicum chinense]|nr:hypothetical protein BC332_03357 [Capsicum chinense]
MGAMVRGDLVPWCAVPWCLGTMVRGALVPWCTMPWWVVRRFHAAMVCGALVPWCVPWYAVSWCLSAMVPWSAVPWCLGSMDHGARCRGALVQPTRQRHHHGPDRYAYTRTLLRISRSVDGASLREIPPINFLKPFGFTRSLTRTHRVILPDMGLLSERLSAIRFRSPDAQWAVATTTKRVKLQPPLAATSIDVDSHLVQPRARHAWEASIHPAITAYPVIEVRCKGVTRCMTPNRCSLSLMGLGATCIQRLDGSRDSAIHTKYHILLYSLSMRESKYPLPKVIFIYKRSTGPQTHAADKTRGAVPWYLGTWCLGTILHGAMVHGTLVLWCAVPWCHGTQYLGTMVPWRRGAIVPWFHGALVPRRHGALAPWCYGSRYHGALVIPTRQRHHHGAMRLSLPDVPNAAFPSLQPPWSSSAAYYLIVITTSHCFSWPKSRAICTLT